MSDPLNAFKDCTIYASPKWCWHIGYNSGPVFRIWWLGWFNICKDLSAWDWWRGWQISWNTD